MNTITKKILSITLLMLLAIGAAAEGDIDPGAEVNVTVNAPEYVLDTFEVTIDVTEVSDMHGGQFDLTFDPDVTNVVDVEDGNIDDTEIPVVMWRFMDDDKIRVFFKLKKLGDCVSGSGYLAKIIFEVVGDAGDTSVIDIPADISDDPADRRRMLGDCIGSDEIPANWFGTNVTIGTAPAASDEAPPPTKSPTIVAASAPEPTATSIETPLLESESKPSASTARAQDAPAAIVPSASSEKDELQDVLTTHNFITIYSFIGLLAFIYAFTLLR